MTARSNRRTAIRHARRMRVPCSLKRVLEEEPFSGTVTLLTGAALRLRAGHALSVGTYVAVDLPDGHGQLLGQAFRVSLARPDGTIEGLFSKKLEPIVVEATRALLRGGGWRTQCRLIRVRQEGPWLVTMHNVSHSGIGFVAERPFDAGSFLEVSLPSIRRSRLQPRLVRITHARQQAGSAEWLLGAVFLRPLSEQELQVLL
jgi:hypothetical protein